MVVYTMLIVHNIVVHMFHLWYTHCKTLWCIVDSLCNIAVSYTLYIVQHCCIIHTVHCTTLLYHIHCTLYNIVNQDSFYLFVQCGRFLQHSFVYDVSICNVKIVNSHIWWYTLKLFSSHLNLIFAKKCHKFYLYMILIPSVCPYQYHL